MKLNSKIYRAAADHMGLYTKETQVKNYVDLRFSCNAVRTLATQKHLNPDSYEEIYIETFASTETYSTAFLLVDDIEEDNKYPNEQTQLHRALMLDLMAEMIEQGDV